MGRSIGKSRGFKTISFMTFEISLFRKRRYFSILRRGMRVRNYAGYFWDSLKPHCSSSTLKEWRIWLKPLGIMKLGHRLNGRLSEGLRREMGAGEEGHRGANMQNGQTSMDARFEAGPLDPRLGAHERADGDWDWVGGIRTLYIITYLEEPTQIATFGSSREWGNKAYRGQDRTLAGPSLLGEELRRMPWVVLAYLVGAKKAIHNGRLSTSRGWGQGQIRDALGGLEPMPSSCPWYFVSVHRNFLSGRVDDGWSGKCASDGKSNEEQDPITIEPIPAASGGRTPWRRWLVCMCRATGNENTEAIEGLTTDDPTSEQFSQRGDDNDAIKVSIDAFLLSDFNRNSWYLGLFRVLASPRACLFSLSTWKPPDKGDDIEAWLEETSRAKPKPSVYEKLVGDAFLDTHSKLVAMQKSDGGPRCRRDEDVGSEGDEVHTKKNALVNREGGKKIDDEQGHDAISGLSSDLIRSNLSGPSFLPSVQGQRAYAAFLTSRTFHTYLHGTCTYAYVFLFYLEVSTEYVYLTLPYLPGRIMETHVSKGQSTLGWRTILGKNGVPLSKVLPYSRYSFANRLLGCGASVEQVSKLEKKGAKMQRLDGLWNAAGSPRKHDFAPRAGNETGGFHGLKMRTLLGEDLALAQRRDPGIMQNEVLCLPSKTHLNPLHDLQPLSLTMAIPSYAQRQVRVSEAGRQHPVPAYHEECGPETGPDLRATTAPLIHWRALSVLDLIGNGGGKDEWLRAVNRGYVASLGRDHLIQDWHIGWVVVRFCWFCGNFWRGWHHFARVI
ncbi:hypothetical protein CCUS01_06222 [Colletotrichum cuscutae]|uniref:Uncharacterized protein n=1 Tax=Colletotrichum cuscutae TaxID=1209917 RepID=A0AAI9Y497_9PEZI|nr:hypothetical protein CCUS01_06222 [Colletotrichum cuscutae]